MASRLALGDPRFLRLRHALLQPGGFALARVRARHGIQDPVDERCSLSARVVSGLSPCNGRAVEPRTASYRYADRGPRSEIAAPRPTDWLGLLLNVFAIKHVSKELPKMVSNAFGHIGAEEKTFVPESEWPKIVRDASVTLGVYAVVLATSVAARSVLPLLYIGLPSPYGAWLYLYFGLTQHAGLPENVLDYRTNCRTVIMNPVFRFLYWNMNYHIEHHMFPMVPFHALERLTIA